MKKWLVQLATQSVTHAFRPDNHQTQYEAEAAFYLINLF